MVKHYCYLVPKMRIALALPVTSPARRMLPARAADSISNVREYR